MKNRISIGLLHMKRLLFLFILTTVVFVEQDLCADINTHLRGSPVSGLYKMHGNENIDGHHPTEIISGFNIAYGLNKPISQNGIKLRTESSYVFGYFYPATQYSAFTSRFGIELEQSAAKVVPYKSVGIGVFALDPAWAQVNTGILLDFTSGIRILLKNNCSVNCGYILSRGWVKYSERPIRSMLDLMLLNIGLHKIF